MSNFIEINSAYRNRNLWPIPGQFEIPINGTGSKTKYDAFDPVSLSEPFVYWTIDYLTNTLTPNIINFTRGIIALSSIDDNYVCVLQSDNNIPQQKDNYFTGLCIVGDTGIRSRILTSKYIGYSEIIGHKYYEYLFELLVKVLFPMIPVEDKRVPVVLDTQPQPSATFVFTFS